MCFEEIWFMLSPVLWFVERKCTHSLLSHHNVYDDGMSFSLSLQNKSRSCCVCVCAFDCLGGINVFLELQCSSCSFVYTFFRGMLFTQLPIVVRCVRSLLCGFSLWRRRFVVFSFSKLPHTYVLFSLWFYVFLSISEYNKK